MRYCTLLLVLLAATGCQTPLHVETSARVRPEFPTVGNAGPLVGMTVLSEDNGGCTATVAVIDVDGLLLNTNFTGLTSSGENPVSLFHERLQAVEADPSVRALVLRINSHGGGVTATDIMWHDLWLFRQRTRLPIVACILDVGAGGAYYLATAADQIVAHPTSITGGIGVILNTYNMQDALQQFNITAVPVKAGEKIDLGSPVKTMDDERRKLLQAMADEFHVRFRKVVQDARPELDGNDKTTFDGRVFTAHQALERKLIDRIGYLDDAVAIARATAHVNSVRVVLYHRSDDQAHSPYSITPNIPLGLGLMPISLPGFDRSRLPGFLYLWEPEPTMEKLSGK